MKWNAIKLIESKGYYSKLRNVPWEYKKWWIGEVKIDRGTAQRDFFFDWGLKKDAESKLRNTQLSSSILRVRGVNTE